MSEPVKYRNSLGVEIEITGYHGIGDRRFLGTFYAGVIRDDLFGDQHLIVEPAALTNFGYVKVDE